MINIAATKESFERNEVATISWIRCQENIADDMTKMVPNKTFNEYVRTKVLNYNVDQSVVRARHTNHSNRQTPLTNSPDRILEAKAFISRYH